MAKRKKRQRRERGSGTLSWDERRQRWRAISPLGQSKYVRTREEAERWLATQGELGPEPEPPATVKAALIAYVLNRTHVQHGTAHREDFATLHINAHIGDLELTAVKVTHIAAMDKALRAELAGSSVKGILSFLSGFFEHLIGYETPGILRNPVKNYLRTTPSRAREGTPGRQGVALDYGMVRILLKELRDDPYHPHICWLLCTGMRVSELAGLRWVNVGPDVIRIVEQLREDDRSTPKPLKMKRTIGDGRTIPLVQQLVTLTPRAGDGLVFPGYDGQRFNRRGLAVHLTDACTRARLPHLTIHDLRHTANSGWADLGMPESIREAITGHAGTTMNRRYTHHSLEAMRPVMEQWAGLILGESGGKVVRIGA